MELYGRDLGVAQAERYVRQIRDACAALSAGNRRGKSVDEIRPGYRKLAVGSHVLFYRVADPDVIDVIRILHRRMDADARLRD